MTSHPPSCRNANYDHAAGGGQDFDPQWWEQHYQDAPAEPAGQPGAQLVAEVAGMAPGSALEAGCGTGADAIWLASQGWEVTAVDVSPTAVQQARNLAARHEPGVTGPISWLVADLTGWQPSRQYDLVVSQYVHPDVPFSDFVGRLAWAVASAGTLLVVGHDHADSHSATRAPRTASIGADAVVSALDPAQWEVDIAEARARLVMRGSTALTLADLVVRAHRKRTI